MVHNHRMLVIPWRRPGDYVSQVYNSSCEGTYTLQR
jgi:hypothetical protein